MNPASVVLLSALAALVPAALFVLIVWWADQYEKEPGSLLIAVFLWGAVPSVVISLGLRLLFEFPLTVVLGTSNGNWISIAILAPIIEETVKAVALVALLFFRREEIDTPLDGIIYGAMVGLGFGVVENTLYFMAQYSTGGIEAWATLVVVRAWLFGLTHALFSAIVGLGVAVGRLSPTRTTRYVAPIALWAVAILLHIVHNIGALSGGLLCGATLLLNWGGVWLVALIVVWSLRQERHWIRQYLTMEVVVFNTITHEQLAVASSTRQRYLAVGSALLQHGWRRFRLVSSFYHRCSELAYLKNHLNVHPTPENAAAVERKRAEVRALSRRLGRAA